MIEKTFPAGSRVWLDCWQGVVECELLATGEQCIARRTGYDDPSMESIDRLYPSEIDAWSGRAARLLKDAHEIIGSAERAMAKLAELRAPPALPATIEMQPGRIFTAPGDGALAAMQAAGLAREQLVSDRQRHGPNLGIVR